MSVFKVLSDVFIESIGINLQNCVVVIDSSLTMRECQSDVYQLAANIYTFANQSIYEQEKQKNDIHLSPLILKRETRVALMPKSSTDNPMTFLQTSIRNSFSQTSDLSQ